MGTLIGHREVALLIAVLFSASVVSAQSPSSPTTHHTRPTAAHAVTAAPVVEAPPPPPNWPVNDQPTHAQVKWDSAGLQIDAENSSLQQILADVATATGTKVEGFAGDERVFGDFGPGQPRDILAQLLQGSGYNIVMIGDQGRGAPRQVLLTARKVSSGTAQPASRSTAGDNDDDAYDNQIDTQPPQPAQPMQPVQPQSPVRPGFGPDGQMRTPQQIQQELLQRQQQILQQQQQIQQQGNPQPGNTQPPN
jgi:hypothetical protein